MERYDQSRKGVSQKEFPYPFLKTTYLVEEDNRNQVIGKVIAQQRW